MPKPTKDEPKATRKKGLTEGTKAKSNTKKRANESAPPKKCAAAPKARRTKAQQPGLSEEERTVTFNRGTIPLLYHSPSFDVDMQHFMLRTALEQPHLKCQEIDDKTAAEGYTNSKGDNWSKSCDGCVVRGSQSTSAARPHAARPGASRAQVMRLLFRNGIWPQSDKSAVVKKREEKEGGRAKFVEKTVPPADGAASSTADESGAVVEMDADD